MIGDSSQHRDPVSVTAPGKIILSGEHAVVYGRPALLTAVDRTATARISATPARELSVSFPSLGLQEVIPLDQLPARLEALTGRYEQFLEGKLSIEEVTDRPTDLIVYAVALVLARFHLKPRRGLDVLIESGIPHGCGMGSSAGILAAVVKAVAEWHGIPFAPERTYQYALEAEKLQHGRPSGADPYVATHGGMIRFRSGAAERRFEVPARDLQLALTGTPACTTGECVMAVAAAHEHSAIWDRFADVTGRTEHAIVNRDRQAWAEAIRENHRLLCEIGVVPERVQRFVAEAEAAGSAAKVCGAGAVRGDAAGVVLLLPAAQPLDDLCNRYGYERMDVRAVPDGVRVLKEEVP